MSAGDADFDALQWAARSLTWERRLRELEEANTAEQSVSDSAGVGVAADRPLANCGNAIVRVRVKKA